MNKIVLQRGVVAMYEKMEIKEVEEKLKTSINKGLSTKIANDRLKMNGKNVLTEKKKENILKLFMTQLNDPMIYILMIAVVISLFLKEIADVFIILTVVVLNGFIGVIQEAKAERAIEALKDMTQPVCVVKRDGNIMTIKTEELVVGDVVELEAGQKIPADVRLVESKKMKIVESSLTGESVPTIKNANKKVGKVTALGDKENMAFMSTVVVNGRGSGIVVATGMNTEIGKIARMLKKEKTEMTPLQKKLSNLGGVLGGVTVGLCFLLLIIGVVQKRNLYTMLLTSISLAVAAIPEGLPAVVTIVLSLGVQRMAKMNTIVRKLSSVETLGSVNVVCSDKTGTLTQNKMEVNVLYMNNRLYEVKDSEKCSFLVEGMMLCNDANSSEGEIMGDPTEVALIKLGESSGVSKKHLDEKYKRVNEIPFDSNRKMMSTIHDVGSGLRVYTKGAAEEVVRNCSEILVDGRADVLTEKVKNEILTASRKMSSEALRVLALGYKDASDLTENNLIFVGLVGMKDPIRQEAKNAVETFKEAGIKTVMITGDHIETAFSVAKELGIADNSLQCISGKQLEEMGQKQLESEIEKYRVFARVSPENKVSIVKALKAKGMVVAMTGDGVNDAPSLKNADVGISMGIIGTDVAKEASDMILNDDNFASIEKAVEEGRVIYSNIKKSVLFLLSSNFAEIVAMVLAVVFKSPIPLLAIHVLWINLITDSIPALALGSDPKEDDVMKSPPRKQDESLFANGGVWTTIFYGLLIGALCLASFFSVPMSVVIAFGENVNISRMIELLQTDGEILKKAQTFCFVTLSTCELAHALTMRNVGKSFVRKDVFKNKLMIASLLLGFVLQWVVIEVPFMNAVFKTSDISFGEWCFVIGCALMVLVAHEVMILLGKKERVSCETSVCKNQ